jgi:hypothetical protein
VFSDLRCGEILLLDLNVSLEVAEHEMHPQEHSIVIEFDTDKPPICNKRVSRIPCLEEEVDYIHLPIMKCDYPQYPVTTAQTRCASRMDSKCYCDNWRGPFRTKKRCTKRIGLSSISTEHDEDHPTRNCIYNRIVGCTKCTQYVDKVPGTWLGYDYFPNPDYVEPGLTAVESFVYKKRFAFIVQRNIKTLKLSVVAATVKNPLNLTIERYHS